MIMRLTPALALLPCAVGAAWLAASAFRPATAHAEGAGADTSSVDAIIDRLEKRLLDQEGDGLTFSEKSDNDYIVKPSTKPSKTYKFDKGQKIEAAPTQMDELKSVGSLVTELETEVDHLASAVQKTKQQVLDEAAIDNFVSIEASLADTDEAAIKTLTVKIDGYSVYELAEAAGLWMPSKSVPLFAGPLQPGTHRLDLEARLVMRHKQPMPMNSDVYRSVNKTFDVTVGGGNANARWILAITPPQAMDGAADATLKQAL
jgi:hypothetical protein